MCTCEYFINLFIKKKFLTPFGTFKSIMKIENTFLFTIVLVF